MRGKGPEEGPRVFSLDSIQQAKPPSASFLPGVGPPSLRGREKTDTTSISPNGHHLYSQRHTHLGNAASQCVFYVGQRWHKAVTLSAFTTLCEELAC